MYPVSVPPKIEYDAKLKEPIIVRAGKKTMIDTTITGVPDVTGTWTCDGKVIETLDNLFVELKPSFAKVTILVTQGNQAGLYKLHVENSAGSDEAEFTVKVLGEYLNGAIKVWTTWRSFSKFLLLKFL